MGEEKRRYVRIDKRFSVSFRKVKDFLSSGSRNKNISEGGICLPLYQYFPEGSLLEVEINSDDFKAPIKAKVRLVWIVKKADPSFPFEAGLEFLEIAPAEREELRNYIKNYAAEGGEQDIRWID